MHPTWEFYLVNATSVWWIKPWPNYPNLYPFTILSLTIDLASFSLPIYAVVAGAMLMFAPWFFSSLPFAAPSCPLTPFLRSERSLSQSVQG